MFRYAIQRSQDGAITSRVLRATPDDAPLLDASGLEVPDAPVTRSGGPWLAGEERRASVLFVDLRGYTRLAELRSAREIHTFLSTYTRLVAEIVHRRGGRVLDLNGDGAMTVFGALTRLARMEAAAVAAALDLVDAMRSLRLDVAIGIATGETFVGCLPSHERAIPCVVGNTTILASRLEVLCRSLGASIAIDEATSRNASPLCRGFVRHAGIQIRGRRRREVVYTLPASGAEGRSARLGLAPATPPPSRRDRGRNPR